MMGSPSPSECAASVFFACPYAAPSRHRKAADAPLPSESCPCHGSVVHDPLAPSIERRSHRPGIVPGIAHEHGIVNLLFSGIAVVVILRHRPHLNPLHP